MSAVDILALDAIDHNAADWLATLRAAAEGRDEVTIKPGWRGVMVHKFDEHEIDEETRHVFCAAVTGHESSTEMEPRWWPTIGYWLDNGGAARVPCIVAAVLGLQGQAKLPGLDPVVEAAVKMGAEVRPIAKKEKAMDKKGKSVSVTSPDDLPHLKTVAVNYERKFNLGDYNSATIGFTAWADIEEGDDLDTAIEAMWDYAKEQVKAQALPLLKHDQTPPQAGKLPAPEAQPAPPAKAAPPAPGADAPGPEGDHVEAIDRVLVTAPSGKPQVEFWRTGRRYPELKWNLGGEALLKLAPALAEAGWTVEHFDTVGAEYTVKWSVSWVESPKNPKWHDVTGITLA